MNTSEIKLQILDLMKREYEKGNNGMVALEPLSLHLGVSFECIRPVVWMLHEQGVIETVIGEQHARLTPRGVETALDSDPAVPRQPPQTINFNASINQSAIAWDKGHASISIDNRKVENFMKGLSAAIDEAGDIPGERKRTGNKRCLSGQSIRFSSLTYPSP